MGDSVGTARLPMMKKMDRTGLTTAIVTATITVTATVTVTSTPIPAPAATIISTVAAATTTTATIDSVVIQMDPRRDCHTEKLHLGVPLRLVVDRRH